MSGEEKTVDRDRCIVWDMLYKHGPMDASDISWRAKQHGHLLSLNRIGRVVDHAWFATDSGVSRIATTSAGAGK